MQIPGFQRILVVNNESETIIEDVGQRFPASDYKYGKSMFTSRQENFYQNLLQIYRITQEKNIAVGFFR